MSVEISKLHGSSVQLYGAATALDVRAERCRGVARVLEARRAVLIGRHEPVIQLHSEAVWMGRAASASRERLRRVMGVSLYLLGQDLAAVTRALLAEADTLNTEAGAVRRRARAAEIAEIAEAAEAAEIARQHSERSQTAVIAEAKIRSRRPR